MKKMFAHLKFFLLRLTYSLKYNAKLKIGKNSHISIKAQILLKKNSSLIIGNNVRISDNTRLIVHENASMYIADNVYISYNTIISSNSSVVIGNDCSIAHFVTIIDTNHVFKAKDKKINEQGGDSAPIKISEDCWIGAGVVILKGVTIGKHCVVGANSVVNKSFDVYANIKVSQKVALC